MLSDRELLLEIHQMLCKVCNHIDKVESEEYKSKNDLRAFNINVAADLYAETISREKSKWDKNTENK